jgi:hypothetical protein
MDAFKKLSFDLSDIAQAFDLSDQNDCQHLNEWLNASYTLNDIENSIFQSTYKTVVEAGDSWNEEELRVRLIGAAFMIANIEITDKVRLFYERPISAIVKEYKLSVICDCLIASSRLKTPVKPYFFLQELKKAKGEKKDPEAQMLTAMLIAQQLNQDEKPIYGSYLLGTSWRFTSLIGNKYCVSKKYESANIEDFKQIIFILKKLKEIIINR